MSADSRLSHDASAELSRRRLQKGNFQHAIETSSLEADVRVRTLEQELSTAKAAV
jgi:hypothetical protein